MIWLSCLAPAQADTTNYQAVSVRVSDGAPHKPDAFTNLWYNLTNNLVTGKWDRAEGLSSTEVLRIYIEGSAYTNAVMWTGKTDLVEFLLTSDVFRVYLDGLGSSNAVMWTGKWDKADGLATADVFRSEIDVLTTGKWDKADGLATADVFRSEIDVLTTGKWDKADGLSTAEVLRGQIEILESATHARQHAINSADDHVGLEAVQNNIVIFDGFGFPVVDSGTALSALLHADGSVTWTGDQPANENGIDDVGKLQTTGNDYLFFSRADAEWCAGNAAGTDKVYIDLQPAGDEYIMVVYTEVGNQFQVGDWGIGLAQGPTNINEISTDTSLSGTDRALPTVPAVKGYADTKLPLATNTPSGSGKIPYSTGTTGTNWYWADAPAAGSSVTGSVQVGSETNAANVIRTTFVASQATQTVMDVWLSDAVAGPPLATAPDGGATWIAGTNLYAYAANKHYRALSDSSGKIVLDWTESVAKSAYANLSVGPLWSYGGPLSWTNIGGSELWWEFTTTNAGVLIDSSPLGNNPGAEPNGTSNPLWENVTGANYALHFDGTDDYVSRANLKLNGIGAQTVGTISAWAYIDADNNDLDTIVTVSAANGSSANYFVWYYHMGAGKDYWNALLVGGGTSMWNVATAVDTTDGAIGKWAHLAFVKTAGSMNMYWNATNMALTDISHTDWTAWMSAIAAPTNVIVGRQLYDSTYYHPLDGSVDEVQFYPYAMTATQVTNLFNEQKFKFGM